MQCRVAARASGHSEQKAGISPSQALVAMQGRSGRARASQPINPQPLDASLTSLSPSSRHSLTTSQEHAPYRHSSHSS